MSNNSFDKKEVISILNKILEAELAGVVRYTHYSFMIFGHNRIPIVSWLRDQASESMLHAQEAGELITHFGGHPSLGMGALLESHKHNTNDILQESLEHEQIGLQCYYDLLKAVEGKSVLLEEYARKMIMEEEMHIGDVDKMMRKPGDISSCTEK
jgi:bacterioferritin